MISRLTVSAVSLLCVAPSSQLSSWLAGKQGREGDRQLAGILAAFGQELIELGVGLDELGEFLRQAPLAGHEAGGLGVRPAELGPLQVATVASRLRCATFEQLQILGGLLLGEQRNGHVLQQRAGEQVFGVLQAEQLAERAGKQARRSESCHRLFRSNGPHLGFGIRLKTALHSEKFLIVRMPTSVIASLTLEISREKPKYDELTNFEHLAGQARIGLDRHGELGRAVVGVLRQLEQANRTLRQGGQLGAS